MTLIFAGTPPFAAVALDALVEAGFAIGLVLTQPDRPAGRGLRTQESAVKLRAQAHGLALAQPANLKDPGIQATLSAVGAQAMVVAAYGLILPPAVLNIPARGCLNIHASLLPRWRGAAPIQRALLAGDTETGITIMQMDEGLDTGPMLLQQRVAIAGDDTGATLHDKLARVGAGAIVQALRTPFAARAQDSALATYAEKITKAEAAIDWARDAGAICRQVRAFNPTPGAATAWNGSVLKIWRATVAENGGASPGTVVKVDSDGIFVAAGSQAVKITELQKAGGKRLPAAQFLAGAALAAGSRLGT
jgi:methionyl-tRNA formyltransferase